MKMKKITGFLWYILLPLLLLLGGGYFVGKNNELYRIITIWMHILFVIVLLFATMCLFVLILAWFKGFSSFILGRSKIERKQKNVNG